jgi:voltage-gated potassium channel
MKQLAGYTKESLAHIRRQVYIVIFGTRTRAGKLFDILLIWAILVSILLVMIESLPQIEGETRIILRTAEWAFTLLFTLEYCLRVWSVRHPVNYIFSFWGFVDILSILPTYAGLFFHELHILSVIRIIRLLRIFNILRMSPFMAEAQLILSAMKASRYKILVFLTGVITLIVILGSLMYLVEEDESGFTSIPHSIYWTIVTITTVGFGDIVPHSVAGKFIASVMMLIGYALIAVPTGIVSVEINRAVRRGIKCMVCGALNERDARFCKNCGHPIDGEDKTDR